MLVCLSICLSVCLSGHFSPTGEVARPARPSPPRKSYSPTWRTNRNGVLPQVRVHDRVQSPICRPPRGPPLRSAPPARILPQGGAAANHRAGRTYGPDAATRRRSCCLPRRLLSCPATVTRRSSCQLLRGATSCPFPLKTTEKTTGRVTPRGQERCRHSVALSHPELGRLSKSTNSAENARWSKDDGRRGGRGHPRRQSARHGDPLKPGGAGKWQGLVRRAWQPSPPRHRSRRERGRASPPPPCPRRSKERSCMCLAIGATTTGRTVTPPVDSSVTQNMSSLFFPLCRPNSLSPPSPHRRRPRFVGTCGASAQSCGGGAKPPPPPPQDDQKAPRETNPGVRGKVSASRREGETVVRAKTCDDSLELVSCQDGEMRETSGGAKTTDTVVAADVDGVKSNLHGGPPKPWGGGDSR